MADLSVRPALPGDARAIAAVQRAALAADHPEIDAGLLDALASEDAISRWEEAVRHPPSSSHRLLCALEDQRVVGFAALAPAEDPDVAGLELLELRVHPASSREGHGSRLLAAVVDVLAPQAVPTLSSWVAVGTALESLLEATGWSPDGSTRSLDLPGLLLPQRRWATSLLG
ncbi:MAG: hypothetical protein QOJ92_2109 [Frankiales bacterium]|nr:hypothetical protein [Frankiales bacterium]